MYSWTNASQSLPKIGQCRGDVFFSIFFRFLHVLTSPIRSTKSNLLLGTYIAGQSRKNCSRTATMVFTALRESKYRLSGSVIQR